MLIEFKYKNFRSFKEEQVFSMKATSSKNKPDNYFEVELANGKKIKLLRSAVLYGANASGKTNFIYAFRAFQVMVQESGKWNIGDLIEPYTPFEFDIESAEAPIEFSLNFLDERFIRYEYKFSFDRTSILEESLNFFPNGYPSNLFKRNSIPDSDIHEITLGKSLEDKRINKKALKNQLYLSKVGGIILHDQLTPIYHSILGITVWNALRGVEELVSFVSKKIIEGSDTFLLEKLSKLINVANTQINKVEIKTSSESDFDFPEFVSEKEKQEIMLNFKYRPFAIHNVYSNKKKIQEIPFSLDNESAGTKVLFAIGGLILDVLRIGNTIFLDEFDNSLHPKLCQFLIRLFHNSNTNQKNAQLIFATHEVSLLDKAIFRKDQIWFTEKNKRGESEIFSAQDFEDVRDNTPFDKWYMAGKFGGYPKIKALEFINEYE